MKMGHMWVTQRVAKHGEQKTTKCGPFRRLVVFLQSEPGRLAINACRVANIKLSGNEGEAGVPQCIQTLGCM